MKRINDYFVQINQNRTTENRISLCGKLEAMVGNYFLSGAGVPGECVETLYYDSTVGFYGCVPLVKKNIVAYIVENETVAFVRTDMFAKFQADTEEYGLIYIPVDSFAAEEFYVDKEMGIPYLLESVVWIDDDFMSDENIEFDFEVFDIIDSGEKYLNPKHFSVENLSLDINHQLLSLMSYRMFPGLSILAKNEKVLVDRVKILFIWCCYDKKRKTIKIKGTKIQVVTNWNVLRK